MREDHYLVPIQNEGAENNLEQSITANSIDDADDLFVGAKERLMDVNNWSKYAHFADVDFKLADAKEKPLHRKAHRGDHIVVEITGEKSIDRLIIYAIEYDDYPDESRETFAMHIGPASGIEDGAIGATATIVIDRRGKTLAISYHGRNEAVIAAGGGWMRLSNTQWGMLLKGLLK